MRTLFLILLCCAPVVAQSVPAPEKHEVKARTCYVEAQTYWNAVMANAPRDVKRLNQSYKNFGTCAQMAIDTGDTLPNGQHMPWMAEYFANTIGALYAQQKLAQVDHPAMCEHLQLASELAEQAQTTASQQATAGPYTVDAFLDDWAQYVQQMKEQALKCGVKMEKV